MATRRTSRDLNTTTDTASGKTLLLPYITRDFLFFSVQTSSGAHPSVMYQLFPLGVKRPGSEANRSFPSSAEVKHA
jgi:hypothetical protein